MENCRISCDRTGWEFRIYGEMIVGQVDSGSDDADYEWFVRDLPNLEAKYPGWSVTFPEIYRGQRGTFADGVRFMTVKRPDGRETVMEFTYRRLPHKFARSVGVRYEKGQEQGELPVSSTASQVADKQGRRQDYGQRNRKRRKRRNPKVA